MIVRAPVNESVIKRFPKAAGLNRALEIMEHGMEGYDEDNLTGPVFNDFSVPINSENGEEIIRACHLLGIRDIYILDGEDIFDVLGTVDLLCTSYISITWINFPRLNQYRKMAIKCHIY